MLFILHKNNVVLLVFHSVRLTVEMNANKTLLLRMYSFSIRKHNYECDHSDLRINDHVRFFRRRRYDACGSSRSINKFHTRKLVKLQSNRGRPFDKFGHFGEDRREEITRRAENTQRGKICRSFGELSEYIGTRDAVTIIS